MASATGAPAFLLSKHQKPCQCQTGCPSHLQPSSLPFQYTSLVPSFTPTQYFDSPFVHWQYINASSGHSPHINNFNIPFPTTWHDPNFLDRSAINPEAVAWVSPWNKSSIPSATTLWSSMASKDSSKRTATVTKKRGRPPKAKTESLGANIQSSSASKESPKRRGRPPKASKVSKEPTTHARKRKREASDVLHEIARPKRAELAHLATESYYLEDGKPIWTFPDGSEKHCQRHPGEGKKYQWGFEYESLPKDYVGDDRDYGRQLWLDAGGVMKKEKLTIMYRLGYPLGEEDADGDGEEFDAAATQNQMDTFDWLNGPKHDARSPSLLDDDILQAVSRPDRHQPMAQGIPGPDLLKEIQTSQPAVCEGGGMPTPPDDEVVAAQRLPASRLSAQECRKRFGPTKWWCNDGKGKFVCFEQDHPPPRRAEREIIARQATL
ncbi:MAG: hypothetical protein Q9213_001634 [Squamulea squamosa]